MFDVSIIIVSWNAKEFLLDCLDSLMAPPRSISMEIIVVDNASSDGSADAVEADYPDVRLIRNNQNYGFAKGNNIGIQKSQGRYLCLINSDVKVLPGCIPILFDFMEKKPSVGIVAPRMLNYDLSLQCTCRHFPTLWNKFCSAVALNKFFPASQIFSSEQMFYFKHDVTRDIEVIAGCFLMVRRKAFETVGYLDEQFFMYAEDMDWCKRFWQAGWSVVYFPEAESVHYGGASSANEPLRFSIAQEKALFAYWKKYHGKISVFALICITVLQHALRILSLEFMIKTKTEYKKEKKAQLNKHVSCLRALLLE